MYKELAGKICIVTGASRGIGQGIALQLGEAGATVYVTGRKPQQSQGGGNLPTLEQVARDITDRGGKGIAAYVDHGNMDEVKSFFERIDKENNGQLDVLVNNAYAAVQMIFDNMGKAFYETDPSDWDTVNNVGLRNHYYCSVYAARMMVKHKKGLIVHVSSPGGLRYLFNVAYGVGKAGMDRMAADMAVELKPKGVTVVALWPAYVRTQLALQNIQSVDKEHQEKHAGFLGGESIEYAGKAVVALAADPHVISKTGRILLTADIGDEYGFVDIDGTSPTNIRSLRTILDHTGWHRLSSWIPKWIRLPGWALVAGTSKI